MTVIFTFSFEFTLYQNNTLFTVYLSASQLASWLSWPTQEQRLWFFAPSWFTSFSSVLMQTYSIVNLEMVLLLLFPLHKAFSTISNLRNCNPFLCVCVRRGVFETCSFFVAEITV